MGMPHRKGYEPLMRHPLFIHFFIHPFWSVWALLCFSSLQHFMFCNITDHVIIDQALVLLERIWIFLCGNTANPAGREPPVRACGNRLCEFTRVMFCLIHRPHALRCHARHLCLWYWCDNYHGQCDQWLHLPEGCLNITLRQSRLSGVARATFPDKQSHLVINYCIMFWSIP